MNLFPSSLLFGMTSSNEKFEEELRVRVFADGILTLGNFYCLNKVFVCRRKTKYIFLYVLSLFLIFLTGFRAILLACIIVLLFMLYKFKLLKIKVFLIGSISFILLSFVALQTSIVQDRIQEVVERNEHDNFENDDYIRVLLLSYYYSEYFKSKIEFFFGSGMVERITFDNSQSMAESSAYKSEYSKDVSSMSVNYHFFPKDMGLIGLSWEAGIPAVLSLLYIVVLLVITKTDKEYYYISAWGIYHILISPINPRLWDYHNMIYFTIVLVILDKANFLWSQVEYDVKKSNRQMNA